MTDRDELVGLIMDVFDAHDEGHQSTADDLTNRILARWRLVPVEAAVDWSPSIDRALADYGVIPPKLAAQHRAASELTHHDMDAGIYDEDLTDRELKMMKWGRGQGYRQALDAAAMLAEVGGAAAIRELIKRRTDNHGPHED